MGSRSYMGLHSLGWLAEQSCRFHNWDFHNWDLVRRNKSVVRLAWPTLLASDRMLAASATLRMLAASATLGHTGHWHKPSMASKLPLERPLGNRLNKLGWKQLDHCSFDCSFDCNFGCSFGHRRMIVAPRFVDPHKVGCTAWLSAAASRRASR